MKISSVSSHLWFQLSLVTVVLFVGPGRLPAQPEVSAPTKPGTTDDNAAWDQLDRRLNGAAKTEGTASAWSQLAADAKAFTKDYPDSPHARSAARLSVWALIKSDDDKTALSADTITTATDFLADKENAARDRLEITIAFEQARMRRVAYVSRDVRLTAHEGHARALIRDFPDQPEGYGYLLSLAKAETPGNAQQLAQELLSGNGPAVFKDGARRVIARLALQAKPFGLDEARNAIAAAKGWELIVYTWTVQSDGVLDLVRRLSQSGDFRFIGVNLDADVDGARSAAAALKLPGTLFYDGGGLDGPMARQLQLTMSTSLYFIDANGILVDIDGHRTAEAKLASIKAAGEGKK